MKFIVIDVHERTTEYEFANLTDCANKIIDLSTQENHELIDKIIITYQ